MKNSVKTTNSNNAAIINFSAFEIGKEQLNDVKGGEDIIVQDAMEG